MAASQASKPAAQWSNPPRANVLGVGVHAINLIEAADRIEAAIAGPAKGYVCVTGVHGVMEAQRNQEFRNILNRALLVTPDGMPTVWIGRYQGHAHMGRVFGPDLMVEVCRRSTQAGYTHFLYGGRPGVAENLSAVLTKRFPGMDVVGTYTPPFGALSNEQEAQVVKLVSKLKPDIIWVGLSTPRQEQFMFKYLNSLQTKVMVGVGAAFDIHTGSVKDAPQWVKHSGLQWLHRLSQEPGRLWKRYLVNNSSFLLKFGLQFCGITDYPLDSGPRYDSTQYES